MIEHHGKVIFSGDSNELFRFFRPDVSNSKTIMTNASTSTHKNVTLALSRSSSLQARLNPTKYWRRELWQIRLAAYSLNASL
jgi:hypothetical protein